MAKEVGAAEMDHTLQAHIGYLGRLSVAGRWCRVQRARAVQRSERRHQVWYANTDGAVTKMRSDVSLWALNATSEHQVLAGAPGALVAQFLEHSCRAVFVFTLVVREEVCTVPRIEHMLLLASHSAHVFARR